MEHALRHTEGRPRTPSGSTAGSRSDPPAGGPPSTLEHRTADVRGEGQPARTVYWVPTPCEQHTRLSTRATLGLAAVGAAATVATLASLCITDRICEKHDAGEAAGMTFVCALGGFLGGAATVGLASLVRSGADWAEWAVLRVRTGMAVARGLSAEAQLDLLALHARLRPLNRAGLAQALARMREVFDRHPQAITAERLARTAASLVPEATGESEAMIGRVWRFIQHLYVESDLPLEVRNSLHLQLGFSVVPEPD